MATIIMNGQLQPARVSRTTRSRSASHRSAVRRAAATREVKRVYRRRRIGLFASLVVIGAIALVSVFSVFGTKAAADSSVGRANAPKYIVAQPGDTLWSIGERIAPNASISEVVDELVRLNGTSIANGQLIRIP